MKIRRTIAGALIALAGLTAVPATAGAEPTYNGEPCVPMGCSDGTDAVDCWVPQGEGWDPKPTPYWGTEKLRLRTHDERWEILLRIDPTRCPEVLRGWRVHEDDVPAVTAYLKSLVVEPLVPTSIVIDGEEIPWTLDLYDWLRLADCESGQRWHIDAFHDGGLQFHPATWLAYGGAEYAPVAWRASAAEQIEVARRVLDGQGPGAWPTCGPRIGWDR